MASNVKELEETLTSDDDKVSDIRILSKITNFITFLNTDCPNEKLLLTYFANMNLEFKNLLTTLLIKEYSYTVFNTAEVNLLILFELIEYKFINNTSENVEMKSAILANFFITLKYFKSLSLLLKLLFCIKKNNLYYNNIQEVQDMLINPDKLICNNELIVDKLYVKLILLIFGKTKFTFCVDKHFLYIYLINTGCIQKYQINQSKKDSNDKHFVYSESVIKSNNQNCVLINETNNEFLYLITIVYKEKKTLKRSL